MFKLESAACWNLSAHIGARTVMRALLALFSAICLAVLSSIHPPQLKPMTAVARKPATAPCAIRTTDWPCRIKGNSRCFLSPDIVRSEGGGDPDGFRSID